MISIVSCFVTPATCDEMQPTLKTISGDTCVAANSETPSSGGSIV